MDKKQNKFIAVAYKLYAAGEKSLEFIEEATDEKPFVFISGFGFTLDEFEKQVIDLEKGAEFNFTLEPDQAFGPKDENLVMKLAKSILESDGKFDAAKVKPGAMVPMQTEEGYRMDGLVVEVGDKEVTLDFNHQLAGERVKYAGRVLLVRDATPEELAPKHHHCDCGCDCEHDHCHGCEGCN